MQLEEMIVTQLVKKSPTSMKPNGLEKPNYYLLLSVASLWR